MKPQKTHNLQILLVTNTYSNVYSQTSGKIAVLLVIYSCIVHMHFTCEYSNQYDLIYDKKLIYNDYAINYCKFSVIHYNLFVRFYYFIYNWYQSNRARQCFEEHFINIKKLSTSSRYFKQDGQTVNKL